MDPYQILLMVAVYVAYVESEAASTPCDVITVADDEIHADCRARGLLHVPANFEQAERRITSLDLSLNNITSLEAGSFQGFAALKTLNLSKTGLLEVNQSAFHGLTMLKTLDLSFNPFLSYKGVPETLLAPFKDSLRELHLASARHPVKETLSLGMLSALEELSISFNGSLPNEFNNLPKVRVLTFAFCVDFQNLSREFLAPFQQSHLEELTFHSCGIKHVDTDSFQDLPFLKLLNLECNRDVSMVNVLESLVASNVRVETLVLDLVGAKSFHLDYKDPIVLGGTTGECAEIWRGVRRLSVRSTYFSDIRAECFESLEALNLGYNPLLSHGTLWSLTRSARRLHSLEMSFFKSPSMSLFYHIEGCVRKDQRIPSGDNYFQGPWSDSDAVSCDLRTDDNDVVIVNKSDAMVAPSHCHDITVPRCLTSVNSEHTSFSLPDVFKNVSCWRIKEPNNISYVNISHQTFFQSEWDIPAGAAIYGLSNLTILKMNDVKLRGVNSDFLKAFPALRELHLRENKLGKGAGSLFARPWPRLEHLETVDLAENSIETLHRDVFSNLTSLQLLDLSFNDIKDVEWLISVQLQSLKYLYLRGNRNGVFSQEVMDALSTPGVDIEIDLRDNTLSCGCEQLIFWHWAKTTTCVRFAHAGELQCHKDGGMTSFSDLDIDADCGQTKHDDYIYIIVPVTVLVCFGVSVVFIVKLRRSRVWKYKPMISFHNSAMPSASIV